MSSTGFKRRALIIPQRDGAVRQISLRNLTMSGRKNHSRQRSLRLLEVARLRPRSKRRPILELLEDRTLMTGLPTISINNLAVIEGSQSVTVTGSLNPGQQANEYTFNGTAGETVDFTNISNNDTSPTWTIHGPDGAATSRRHVDRRRTQGRFAVHRHV